MNLGRPSPTQTAPPTFTEYSCECTTDKKKSKVITFFMLHAQAIGNVYYCPCRPLASEIVTHQFMPTSASSPNIAIHFAIFDNFHIMKMEAHVSNHTLVQIYNKDNHTWYNNPFTFKRTIANNLNALYWLYSRTLKHAKDRIRNKYNLKEERGCFLCAVSC
jgi:hypothetical protein